MAFPDLIEAVDSSANQEIFIRRFAPARQNIRRSVLVTEEE